MTPVYRIGAAIAVGVLCIALLEPALAQARHPFAVGGQEGASAATGLGGVILAWQNKFHAALQTAARGLKDDPRAFLALGAASFAYGVFHAAGPGHGKAVLASYMLANETALRRGLLLAGLAALLQGLVAIAIVGVLAIIFNATAARMTDAARLVELASYAAIAVLGARLLWVKGRAFLEAWKTPVVIASPGGFICEAIDPNHVHDATCNHFQAPDPATLSGPTFRWGSAIATVVAAGFRPCSGAILVLVFTLSQGAFAAGVAAVLLMSLGAAITTGALAVAAVYAKGAAMRLGRADSRRAALIGRAIEALAAAVVLALGVFLLVNTGFGALTPGT